MAFPSAWRFRCWAARAAVAGITAAVLAGCAGAPPLAVSRGEGDSRATPTPRPVIELERDGPPLQPPADLVLVPDAEPRVEVIRVGGPNKPYAVLGQAYTPQTQDLPFRQRGLASWYGRKFHGRRTASGEPYDMYAMTAAHPTLPVPSYVRVRNPATGAQVVVRINDRGPFHSDRIIDVSYTAALKLGLLRGAAPVDVERITFDDIRSGAWREATLVAAVPVAPAVLPDSLDAWMGQAPPQAGAGGDVLPISALRPERETAPLLQIPAAAFWVQLGAFQQRAGAELFHRKVVADVEWLAPRLAIYSEGGQAPHRLQAGPYGRLGEAQDVARQVQETLRFAPLVLERQR